MRVLRTPASRFASLPGWNWGDPQYFVSKLFDAEVRMAYWDLGNRCSSEQETVLLTHGEPSWSYLNRRMIGPLLAKGHRVVLFDQVGFGRSDKPAAVTDYSYERHVAWNEDLLCHHLDLRGITAVFQDWGGLLGLRVVARNADRFDRLVVANTVLPTCDLAFEGKYVSDGFYGWKEFNFKGGLKGDGAVGRLMSRGAAGPSCGPDGKLTTAEIAAYQAPFPNDSFLAGALIFPELVPTPPNDPTGRAQPVGGEANRALWAVFEQWHKPVLLAFAPGDMVLGKGGYMFKEKCPGTKGQAHVDIQGAGHFLQDGGGEQLTKAVLRFIDHNPRPLAKAPLARL